MSPSALAEFPEELRAAYRPVRHLGAGGMGTVFLAEEVALGRPVALKLLGPTMEAHLAERLLREASTLASIEHANVVRIYSVGTSSRGPYLVMEFLDGSPLHQVSRPVNLIQVFLGVAEGLGAAHERGVIHRDVKPSNVVLTVDDRAVLVDFGLARSHRSRTLTRTGAVMGTLGFLAPEVIQGQRATPAADWFGWGASLYVALEGVLPFTTEQLFRMGHGEPVTPRPLSRVPPSGPVAALLQDALSLDPDRRPHGAAAIRRMLAHGDSGAVTEEVRQEPTRVIEISIRNQLDSDAAEGTRALHAVPSPSPVEEPEARSLPWWGRTPGRRRLVKLYLPMVAAWTLAGGLLWWLLRPPPGRPPDPGGLEAEIRSHLIAEREQLRRTVLEAAATLARVARSGGAAASLRALTRPRYPALTGRLEVPWPTSAQVRELCAATRLAREAVRRWIHVVGQLDPLSKAFGPEAVPQESAPLVSMAWALHEASQDAQRGTSVELAYASRIQQALADSRSFATRHEDYEEIRDLLEGLVRGGEVFLQEADLGPDSPFLLRFLRLSVLPPRPAGGGPGFDGTSRVGHDDRTGELLTLMRQVRTDVARPMRHLLVALAADTIRFDSYSGAGWAEMELIDGLRRFVLAGPPGPSAAPVATEVLELLGALARVEVLPRTAPSRVGDRLPGALEILEGLAPDRPAPEERNRIAQVCDDLQELPRDRGSAKDDLLRRLMQAVAPHCAAAR